MATRFYLPSSGAAAVSPSWTSTWTTTTSTRYAMATAKAGTGMSTVNKTSASSANQNHGMVQYVSAPIQETTFSSPTYKLQIRASESDGGDHLFVSVAAKVVSNDGVVLRGTLFDVTRDNTEFALSLVNRQWTLTGSGTVYAMNGDRLVLELGIGGDPLVANVHNGNLRIGDSAGSDLAENNSSTTDNNPWWELSTNVSFMSAAPEKGFALGVATSNYDMANPSNAAAATWSNPTNAYSLNGSNASVVLAAHGSRYLSLYGWGFSVPTGATITGVMVETYGNVSSGTLNVGINLYDDGTDSGTGSGISLNHSWNSLTIWRTVGGSSELWSRSITPALVNDTLWAVVMYTDASSSLTWNLDQLRMTVFYSEVTSRPSSLLLLGVSG